MTKVNCPDCDKTFRTETGLDWHLEHIHAKSQEAETTSQESEGLSDEILTEQPVARLASEQQVSTLEDRLQKLEFITGLRESEPASDGFILVRETTLPEQLAELTKQVSDLQLVEEREYYSRALEDLRERFEIDLNSLAAIVNKYRDAFNHNLADMESRIDKVQKMVENLDEGLSMVRTKLASHSHDGVSKIPELDSKLNWRTVVSRMWWKKESAYPTL